MLQRASTSFSDWVSVRGSSLSRDITPESRVVGGLLRRKEAIFSNALLNSGQLVMLRDPASFTCS